MKGFASPDDQAAPRPPPPTKAQLAAQLGGISDDVYDAHSRASLVEVPASLRDHSLAPKAKRYDLAVGDGVRAFAVADLLSGDECDNLVGALEARGFAEGDDIKVEYPPSYRNSERLIVFDERLGQTLFRRLVRHLSDDELVGCKPMGWQAGGVWKPVGLNDCFLFSRYSQGQKFSPHFDGHYKNNLQEVSIYSMTLYLNDLPPEETGGHLVFYSGTRATPHETKRWRPVRGTAVVFQHDVLHAGEVIVLPQSRKYIARTSVLFARVTNFAAPSVDPRLTRMREIFASFDAIRAAGDPEAFTRAYLEAQELQLAGGSTRWDVLAQPFPLDKHTVTHVFWRFLDIKSIAAMSACCKSWFLLFRSGALWSAIYKSLFGPIATALVNPLAMPDEAVDYFGATRGRCLVAKRLHPHVFHLSNLVWMRYRTPEDCVNGNNCCRLSFVFDAWDCSITNWRVLAEENDHATFWWGGQGWVDGDGKGCANEAALAHCWLSGTAGHRLEQPLVPTADPAHKADGYGTFFANFVSTAFCIVDVIWPHLWSNGRDWQWISNYARGGEYLGAMTQLAGVVRPMGVCVLEAGLAGLLALKRSSGRVACVSGHGVVVLYEYADRVPVHDPVLIEASTWDALLTDATLVDAIVAFKPDAVMCDLSEPGAAEDDNVEERVPFSVQRFPRHVRECVLPHWKQRLPALEWVSTETMVDAARDFGNSPCILDGFVYVASTAGNMFDVSLPPPDTAKTVCVQNLWKQCNWWCPEGLSHKEVNCPTLVSTGSCELDPSACPWLHVPRPPPRSQELLASLKKGRK